jgi:hypothetical protein
VAFVNGLSVYFHQLAPPVVRLSTHNVSDAICGYLPRSDQKRKEHMEQQDHQVSWWQNQDNKSTHDQHDNRPGNFPK